MTAFVDLCRNKIGTGTGKMVEIEGTKKENVKAALAEDVEKWRVQEKGLGVWCVGNFEASTLVSTFD